MAPSFTYTVILRPTRAVAGEPDEGMRSCRITASNGNDAQSQALALAAQAQRQTGIEHRVARVDCDQ